jgi:hypothetical protein
MTWKSRAVRVAIALVFGALAWVLPDVRRAFIRDVISIDGEPGPGPDLPAATGPGLARAAHVRVVLVDGAGRPTARTMASWNALCERGLDLVVDVGFPTVSLPVQIALWTGLTQEQTGILFHSGKPLARPRTDSIPAHVPGSIAVAESHAEIIGSIGFAMFEPPVGKLPEGWADVWMDRAVAAVAGDSRLAFVHILGVDGAGHKSGRDSEAWTAAAAKADRELARLVDAGGAAHPSALWVVLADHDHLAGGGHGGEERALRQVRACVAGPDVERGTGGPIHLVDLSRAIADALGVALPAGAEGRPLTAALAHPLEGDDALPGIPLGAGALAFLVMIVGVGVTAWGMRGQLLLGPWWFPAAALLLVIVRGVPTLSTPMFYKPEGRDMYLAFAPAFVLLAAGAVIALRRAPLERALAALLGLPVAALAALFTVTGAWPIVFGGDAAPIVPRWTGWTSPMILVIAQALAVAALALLASAALPWFGRGAPTETARSEPAAPA